MVILEINETRTDHEEDLPELLRHIADQIEQGYTSGYYPYWDMTKVEDKEKETING